jgi:hypothetical protein
VHADIVHLVFKMVLGLYQKDSALREALLGQRNRLHVFDDNSKNLVVQQFCIAQQQEDVLLLKSGAL